MAIHNYFFFINGQDNESFSLSESQDMIEQLYGQFGDGHPLQIIHC